MEYSEGEKNNFMKTDSTLVQQKVLLLLQKQIEREQNHHAYLFSGESQLEKKVTAEHFIAHLLSIPKESKEKYPYSPILSQIENNTHPDLTRIYPKGKFIQVDDLRHLSKTLSFSPLKGKYRVVLIEDIDQSNAASANSLLKVLEEPPSYVIFILLSREPALLLPTITSRCQIVQFPTLSIEKMTQYLKKEFPEKKKESIEKATLWSESSFERAYDFLKDTELVQKIHEASSMLINLWKSFPSIPSTHMENVEIPRTKEDLDILLDTWTLLVRDMAILIADKEENNTSLKIFHSAYQEELHYIIQTLGIKKIKEHISSKMDHIHISKEHLNFNGNPKLVLGTLICKMQFST